MTPPGETVVAAFTEGAAGKHELFDRVIEASGFFPHLERRLAESGKSRDQFFIAIKPNVSMMLRRADVGTYTDTFLVVHLLRRLLQRGFSRIVVVESQNLYGNWFLNRSVAEVAARGGYFGAKPVVPSGGVLSHPIRVRGEGVDAEVPMIDLTLDKIPCVFDGEQVSLGKTWIEADFRVNIAALKAHFYGRYTMGIKNIYGCLPEQNKVLHYHCRQKVGPWTALLIRAFPVDFTFIDGYAAADGWFGVKMKAIFNKAHTFLAGADILAVDHAGAQLIGVVPEASVMFSSLTAHLPLTPYKKIGNARPFQGWRNVPSWLVNFVMKIERSAHIMDYGGMIATGGNDPCFPRKPDFGGTTAHVADGLAARVWNATRGLAKRVNYVLTLPFGFLMDREIVRLEFRRRRFFARLRRAVDRMPRIAASPFLQEQLVFLAPEDIERLFGILADGLHANPNFSGHILFVGEKEHPFPARMFPAGIAAVEILAHAVEQGISAEDLREELRTLLALYPAWFGRETRYSYCYR